jgi:membrane protein implicated in regulation of membrane protease activity
MTLKEGRGILVGLGLAAALFFLILLAGGIWQLALLLSAALLTFYLVLFYVEGLSGPDLEPSFKEAPGGARLKDFEKEEAS